MTSRVVGERVLERLERFCVEAQNAPAARSFLKMGAELVVLGLGLDDLDLGEAGSPDLGREVAQRLDEDVVAHLDGVVDHRAPFRDLGGGLRRRHGGGALLLMRLVAEKEVSFPCFFFDRVVVVRTLHARFAYRCNHGEVPLCLSPPPFLSL